MMMIRLLDMLNDVGNGGGGYSPDNPKARGEFIKMLVGVGPLFDGLLTYRYNTTKFDNNQGGTHFGVELEVWYKDFWGGEDFEWIQTITQKTGESTVVFNDPPVSDDPPGEFYYFYYTEKEKSDKSLIQRRGQMDAYFYDGPARALKDPIGVEQSLKFELTLITRNESGTYMPLITLQYGFSLSATGVLKPLPVTVAPNISSFQQMSIIMSNIAPR